MKTPLCDACIREQGPAQSSGPDASLSLCALCQAKLSRGEMTRLDADISRILFKINETHNITAARFSRSLDLGSVVLLLTDGEVGLLIGRQGRVVSAISSALGRKVRIAQTGPDLHKTIADIITPARLLGINSAWHGGAELMRVRIPKADLRELPVKIEELEPILKNWLGKPVELVFE